MNSFGRIFRLTDFGESHGESVGGVLDGVPAGLPLDLDAVQQELNRRHSDTAGSTARREPDTVEWLSGIYQGKTTGAPIGFKIKNQDIKLSTHDFGELVFRPSHAEYSYRQKYGHFDPRGGGRASARLTVTRVVAGAVAKQFLRTLNVSIQAFGAVNPETLNTVIQEGDSIGAVAEVRIQNVPAGIGTPLYGKLEAELAYACMSIPAAVGFEYGEGFKAAEMKGSEYNDILDENFRFLSNHSGGIQGGISNGQDIYFRVAFKPIPTLGKAQDYVTKSGKKLTFANRDRKDVCVLPRVLVVLEAVTAMVILDQILLQKTTLC